MIDINFPDLGGRFRLHGQIALPKQPPILIDTKPAARVWFKVPERADLWKRCRLLFWCAGLDGFGWPEGGEVPEAVMGMVWDSKVKIIAEHWHVMGLDESMLTQNRIAVGDWSPTVLMETPSYVRADL